jgi:ABC-type bacteriocin/lantibiotic exporter with double-glycine peptidase domain
MNNLNNFIKRIKLFLLGNRWTYIGIISILNLLAYVYNLMGYKQLADYINTYVLSACNIKSFLMIFVLKMAASHLIEHLSRFLLERQIIYVIRGIFKNLIVKIMNFKLLYFKENSTSKINQLWFYLSSVEYLIEKIILDIPKIFVFGSYYIYTIYSFSPTALLLSIVGNGLMMYLQQPILNSQCDLQEKMMDLDLIAKNRFLESTSNIEYVKLNNQQENEIEKITNNYDKFAENKIKDLSLSHTSTFISKVYNDIFTMVIYFIGISLINLDVVTIPQLMYLGSQTHEFYHKLKDLRDIYNQYNRKKNRINVIYQILTSKHLEKIEVGEIDPKIENFNISFQNVNFNYKQDFPILKDLNLDFSAGKVNLLMGPNGSGKSTIIKLLMGLYELHNYGDNNKNIIKLGGYHINHLQKKFIRQNISFVSQEPHIFNDTVLNNINYGVNCDRDRIMHYAGLLGLHKWVSLNLDKQCGFMGKFLSGGEKKKVQLMQAICSQSEVIIFDEPSNALDKVAIEWYIQFVKELRDKLNKTIIIITHDARLLELSDNTIYIKKANHL